MGSPADGYQGVRAAADCAVAQARPPRLVRVVELAGTLGVKATATEASCRPGFETNETIRDLFAPSPQILARMLAAERARKRLYQQRHAETEPGAVEAASEFIASHELQAVVLGADPHRVVINGRVLVCGETIDGYQLLAVGPFHARLKRDDVRVTLHLTGAVR